MTSVNMKVIPSTDLCTPLQAREVEQFLWLYCRTYANTVASTYSAHISLKLHALHVNLTRDTYAPNILEELIVSDYQNSGPGTLYVNGEPFKGY